MGFGYQNSGSGRTLVHAKRYVQWLEYLGYMYNFALTLNPPEKASLTSRSLKAQTADPPMELGGVLNVAYKMASLVFASSLTLQMKWKKY